ncbi:MAG: hypothetical protein CMP23_10580 [Rickettsiales bacterium]|nr:hypothetical protein [Rickettsiales bacterium]
MARCYSCSAELVLDGRPGRRDECPACAASLHCCFGCRFYDSSAHNQCREVGTELVRDREAANFCDSFEMTQLAGLSSSSTDEQAAAKTALADLFKI